MWRKKEEEKEEKEEEEEEEEVKNKHFGGFLNSGHLQKKTPKITHGANPNQKSTAPATAVVAPPFLS